MMRAKADPKATSNTILILACVVLAGSVVGLLWPKPSLGAIKTKEKKDAKKLRDSRDAAIESAKAARATLLARTWTGDPSVIQGEVYNLTTSLAKKRNVSWLRLQPLKGTPSGDLEQISFLLVVEGPFPAVAALERDLESPANRLAISAFQVSSSDSETNKVSASVNLVAHRVAPDVEEEKPNAKRR